MKVSIIGVGLQFERRAPVIINSEDDHLISISSDNYDKSIQKSLKYGCEADKSWRDTLDREDIDSIIISTPPHIHSEISKLALSKGLHVLCEKPLTRTLSEAQSLFEFSREHPHSILKCGFNHRHHPAILEAKKLLDLGVIGRPLFGRGKYGICGRPEYQKEWRANPQYAAGGHFIEQGSHLIDLFRWFMGEIYQVASMTSTHYFHNQSLDDDGFALFRFESGATASMHTSLVQWQNEFLFEIFGDNGYLKVEGLGGGYGTEKLYVGKKSFVDPFEDRIIQFRGGDNSWKLEWQHFKNFISGSQDELWGNVYDGLRAMQVGLACYESSHHGKFVNI